ncbi:MAG: flagellar basal-body MS-ring/collar protein FliF [Porticoccaceae bacterium]|nr:flagellar basal-body MS-ring/collar protein FliF [Porticoccaceae bacterium]
MVDIVATPQDVALNTLTPGVGAAQPQGMTARQTGQQGGRVARSDARIRQVISQPAIKRAMPAIIALMTIVLFAIVYSWSQASPYRTVYPGLSEADRQAAFEALSSADFSAKIDAQTGELEVPSSRYHEARLYLASRGLPQSSATSSMASLSEEAAMTTSQFMEQVRYISAIERELAASIAKISTIESARVHLASPKQSVFVRNRTEAKASVVISPFPGRVISESQVQAIIHLIASSVPYLATENVSVVDQRGKLLSNAEGFSSLQRGAEQMSHKQRMEETYRNRIEAFLSPVVGAGNVRSEVDIQIDFTETESTYEEYDGNDNGPRARSETLSLEQKEGSQAIGIPGATSNTTPSQLPDNTDKAQSLSRNTLSSTTTRNYEMDRAVRHVKRQGGAVERISVAVVVNPPTPEVLAGEDQIERQDTDDGEFSEKELERFSDLVKSLVGFNADRGDVVTIVSARFEPLMIIEPITEPWYENTQLISLIKSLGIAVVFIALLLLVVRPAIAVYSSNEAVSLGNAANSSAEAFLSKGEARTGVGQSGGSNGMLDTANSYDNKVEAVRLLVGEDSGRVANVLKKMIRDA